jgi:AP endonuclease-1
MDHCQSANAFALFLKSQRKWTAPPLSEFSIREFKARMQMFDYESRHVVPHGSYLINLANPDEYAACRLLDLL